MKHLVFALLLLAGCGPDAAPPITTPWGIAHIITDAPTADSPALYADEISRWLAWTQPLQGETRHMASDGQRSSILALRAWYPMQYQILPAANGNAHWLWIDRSEDTDGLRLQSALVSGDLVAQIGPVVHSSHLTTHYAALPLDNGGVLLVWAQGSIGAETLSMVTLNGEGRASFVTSLGVAGTHPTLMQSPDGTRWLYWITDGSLWRGILLQDALTQLEHVELLPAIALTEQLSTLQVVKSDTVTYIVWQIVRADGNPRALLSRVWDDGRTLPASPIRLDILTTPYETTYNGGNAFMADTGSQSVGWLRPSSNADQPMSFVATWGGTLGILYFHRGDLRGAQPLVETGTLFDAPRLTSDNERHLTITWSQPFTEQTARLFLLTTRR